MKQINFNEPYIVGKEQEYIKQVFDNNSFYGTGIFSQKVTQKIKEILNSEYVLLTDSCTSALEITSLCMKEESKRNEILMPSYTFSSTANAFMKHGFEIKFIDVLPTNLTLNPKEVEKNISKNTCGVVAVHYGSHLSELEQLKQICDDNNLVLVEDAAQAFGSAYRKKMAGTYGNYGCFSFHETKNLHCGLGGAFVTDNADIFEKARIIWERGTNRQQKLLGLVDKYTWHKVGGSYYPTEFQAAFLLAQLEHIKENFNQRKEIYNRYCTNLLGLRDQQFLQFPELDERNTSNFHSFFILVENEKIRSSLLHYLTERRIYAYIGYTPLHSSPVGMKCKSANVENTENYSKRIIRLPFHNNLNTADVNYVSENIISFYDQL